MPFIDFLQPQLIQVLSVLIYIKYKKILNTSHNQNLFVSSHQIKSIQIHIIIMKANIIVFKSHLLPQIKKPFKDISDYMVYSKESFDKQTAKRQIKAMTKRQLNRIKQRKDMLNLQISEQIKMFFMTFIKPLKMCPDYHEMLFDHVKHKLKLENPYFFQNNRTKSKLNLSNNLSIQKTKKSSKQQNVEKYNTTKEVQLKLYRLFKAVRVHQREQVFKEYQKQYNNYLRNSQQFSGLISSEKIYRIKPILYNTPLEFIEVKYNTKSPEEAYQIFQKDQSIRQSSMKMLKDHLEKKYEEMQYVVKKTEISQYHLLMAYKQQFDTKESSIQQSFKNFLLMN